MLVNLRQLVQKNSIFRNVFFFCLIDLRGHLYFNSFILEFPFKKIGAQMYFSVMYEGIFLCTDGSAGN